MSASATTLTTSPRPIARGRRHDRAWLVRLVAIVAGLWALAYWAAHIEERSLRTMPPLERAELFEQARRHSLWLCDRAQSEPPLRDRCAESSEFLLAFPECDDACREEVHHLTLEARKRAISR